MEKETKKKKEASGKNCKAVSRRLKQEKEVSKILNILTSKET